MMLPGDEEKLRAVIRGDFVDGKALLNEIARDPAKEENGTGIVMAALALTYVARALPRTHVEGLLHYYFDEAERVFAQDGER